MLVTPQNLKHVLDEIERSDKVAVDTETTGLRIYHGDNLFSIIVANARSVFYFNFNTEPDHLGNFPEPLSKGVITELISALNKVPYIFKANAKFDWGMVSKLGEYRPNFIHDVLVMERLLKNDQFKISLDSTAEAYGYKKSDAVEEYIKTHKLFQNVELPHRKKKETLKFYHKVPLEIIVPYAETDARITYDIGEQQITKLCNFFQIPKGRSSDVEIERPDVMESKLIYVLLDMEARGLYVDRELCAVRARDHREKYELAARTFHDQTRQVLIDSSEVLSPLFISQGFTPPKTEKENDSISDAWLETIDHPLSNLVRDYRTNYKLSKTFYSAYLYHADQNGMLHANINQSGTRTGRFSYSNPNLQQAPASEVREAFRAPDPNYICVSIDWDQQEYRMMLDYAGEDKLIDAVLSGLDVHQATANLAGVSRKEAKTLNFLLLYGGGVVKLALALLPITVSESELWWIWKTHNSWELTEDDKKWAVSEELRKKNLEQLLIAQDLREKYFEKLPKVKDFINLCKNTARDRGFLYTWSGRRLQFKPEFSYKAPNAIIQGGASDVAKYAMLKIWKSLIGTRSRMVAQIHDEFWFYVHKDEKENVHNYARIMQTTFPHRRLPLTTSIEYSWDNFYALQKLEPGKEIEKA